MKSDFSLLRLLAAVLLLASLSAGQLFAQPVRNATTNSTDDDHVRRLQASAWERGQADWGYWGTRPQKYSEWTNHSNRLIPIYTFGFQLRDYVGKNSIYRQEAKLTARYGRLPDRTLNPQADYCDQTDIAGLQRQAVAVGKKHIILFVFDGMDWQTTWAAATFKSRSVNYDAGRGSGLLFQDYRDATTDFGWMVTSPAQNKPIVDPDAQRIVQSGDMWGGYFAYLGGRTPWQRSVSQRYLSSQLRSVPHAYTDSASAATSMTSGIKTFNGAINVDLSGKHVEPIGRFLQRTRGFSVGVVSSVPLSHATPAAAYANNVSRSDYQDLTRDMVGLPSVAHRRQSLPGVDVLLGAGWGETAEEDEAQGHNFLPGNKYITSGDLLSIDASQGGDYQVVQRTAGASGPEILAEAARTARDKRLKLFGFFGASGGNLPFQTADGGYNPTRAVAETESYTPADVKENPSLAEMTLAALHVLESNDRGFWLMVEPGDVDWANHDNNIDNSIGAVLSGEAAFREVVEWVERRQGWDDTVIIVTADHGHLLTLKEPQALIE